jgi:hypothetical protein
MADDKQGRVQQAHNAERRQWEREIEEARSRADESNPLEEEMADGFQPCHRSGCDRAAMFLVLERYEEADGEIIEETAALCREHTAQEGPMHLDRLYDSYVFRVEQLPELTLEDEA